MNKINIVTDKNFLFSLNTNKSLDLQKDYKFLLCEDLLYESTKDDPSKRCKIFSKLGEPYTDYEFIPIIPTLITFEKIHKKPCAKPSYHIIRRDYSKNKILANKTKEIAQEQKLALQDLEKDYLIQLDAIFQGINVQFQACSQEDASLHMDSLLNGKINDDDHINSIIRKHELSGAKLPDLSYFTKESICYRYFQVYELWKTSIRMLYQKFEDICNSTSARLKIKHDYHDMNYLMLALLEGGFATNEKKLIEWFELLCDKESLVITNS